jgi:hypothetical protein
MDFNCISCNLPSIIDKPLERSFAERFYTQIHGVGTEACKWVNQKREDATTKYKFVIALDWFYTWHYS